MLNTKENITATKQAGVHPLLRKLFGGCDIKVSNNTTKVVQGDEFEVVCKDDGYSCQATNKVLFNGPYGRFKVRMESVS
jgi:hypothetical protein